MEETLPTEKRDQGFTLIELLIAIVVVGILSAVAIVGIGSLVNSGQGASCQATMDATRTATAVHFANTNAWPTTITAMTGASPVELKVQGGVTPAAQTLTGPQWVITLGGGGATEPTLVATGTASTNCI